MSRESSNGREMVEKFCMGMLRPDDDFRTFKWEEEMFPAFAKFMDRNGIDGSPSSFRYHVPLRFIVDGTSSEDGWRRYWLSRNDVPEADYIRKKLCGIGSTKVKLALNNIPTIDAKIMRNVLEVEDMTVSSMKYFGMIASRNLQKRNAGIRRLVDVSKEFPEKIRMNVVDGKMIFCKAMVSGVSVELLWDVCGVGVDGMDEVASDSLSVTSATDGRIGLIERAICKVLGI